MKEFSIGVVFLCFGLAFGVFGGHVAQQSTIRARTIEAMQLEGLVRDLRKGAVSRGHASWTASPASGEPEFGWNSIYEVVWRPSTTPREICPYCGPPPADAFLPRALGNGCQDNPPPQKEK